MTGFPVLVAHLFDVLDPEVGYTHCQTVIESHTSVLDGAGESRHAGHIFGDGDGVLLYLVNQFVSQSEVADSIPILVAVEVRGVAVEVLAQTVTEVHHRRHTVEAETVEIVLLEPELAVGE